MMNNILGSKLVIWTTFLVALILQAIPWPGTMDILRPSWLVLVTCYWVMAAPHRVNVGTGLILGLLWDLLLGSTLGIHGMMMAIVTYLVAINFLVIRNMALWQQALVMALLSMLSISIEFFGEFVIQDVVFNPASLWVALINAILWPWLFLLLRRVRRIWRVR
ncbi:rod shape-determining protein MreD [Vibrio sp. UCD-FRSSP16_10]|uniref:rod shape-determining protein MreD n=1 Tax=unclassified Vibrio TaxID=2614977 RepID=UPI0007FD926E|nr:MULTISPECIES: rod shape-determining protein MreD [unclassified Vibrio]OBT17434.1 rod shape-determining protein MreD [Vibrio sp. UCD-FRSSP16_30]OBT23203.1 rod shape-determining protein MreD [Vibrio sp. UCD-FRSSP16_10]